MTVVLFEELTWPEVSALPRDVPLVLPLGNDVDLEQLSSANGSMIHLLPALPFGWEGSRLDVPASVFTPLLRSLAGNLLEDGFTRMHLLSSSPSPLPEWERMPLNIKKESVHFLSKKDTDKVVILPVGHTEQHGFHVPLSTDTLIIDAIARGTAAAVPDQAVSLPVFPYGVSTHRRSFPGTFNIGGRVFEDFWLSVLDTLVGHGFTRFYLLSGHGGNCSYLTNVVKAAGEKYPHIFCATSFLYLSGPKGVAALEEMRGSPVGGMGHACELETSLMLHLRPDLVHLERAVDEMNFISTPSYYMDWIEGGALIANPPWEDDTRTGAYGAGSLASAEKGDYWLKVAIEEKVDHVGEIHEQYHRRKERREAAEGNIS